MAIADTDFIAAALQRHGGFGDAVLRDVVVESTRPTILSQITRLRLTWQHAGPGVPETLILKTGLPGHDHGSWTVGPREVTFYRDIAVAMTDRVVPRCFSAHWDPGTEGWHLLLEDLGETHVIATTWPLPPSPAQCECIVAALARFHAAWWNDARLGVSIGTLRDEAAVARLVQDMTRHLAGIADVLSRERYGLYERLLAAAPVLLKRSGVKRNLTILHGDAHVWNCFLPRDGGADARLFDWDAWRIGVSTTDLAYMMAIHWYPDRRQRLERHLLDHYHNSLLSAGVRGYDRRSLHDDYRRSVLWQTATPLFQAAHNIPPVIWWNNLERIWLAFDDLGCRELLP
jgi:hypothetical protein